MASSSHNNNPMKLARFLALSLLWASCVAFVLRPPVSFQQMSHQHQQLAFTESRRSDAGSHALYATTKNGDLSQRISKRRKVFRWMQRKGAPLVLAFALSSSRALPAQASTPEKQQTVSLRPGMSKVQAEQLEEGDLDIADIPAASTATMAPPSAPKKQQPTFDYGDADDDEEDDDDYLYDAAPAAPTGSAEKRAQRAVVNRMDTKKQFAAYHQPKTKGLTIKIAVAFFIPTYGSLIVREWYRRRKEEAYVKKGLEILEAQKAEYFNVTTKSADSDVSDELKDLKSNETKTEDGDDDDDDEGNDDDDDDAGDEDSGEPTRRRGPSPPKGGGDDGAGGAGPTSSGDEPNPGYGKPSDEDLDKLNKIFGKS